jgi:hypothetical protein
MLARLSPLRMRGGAEAPGGSQILLWSDASTWPGGVLPAEGEDVIIDTDQHRVLDVVTPSLGHIHQREGSTFDLGGAASVGLIAEGWHTHGDGWTVKLGESKADPFTGTGYVRLTGLEDDPNDGHARGVMFHGNGWVKLYAAAPTPWTKLNAHGAIADDTFTLKDSVEWNDGDEIAVGPTDYIDQGRSELLTLDGPSSGTSIATTTGLARKKWGLLQYLTDSDSDPFSLDIEDMTETLPMEGFPTILDQRAPVGNLTRRFTFEGIDDTSWQNDGFGMHFMMHEGVKFNIYGIAFRRGGQAGTVGRYGGPHAHYLSWDVDTGAFLANVDPEEAYVERCVIRDSSQRGVVVHGTNGMRVKDNVFWNNRCHSVFLEDAIETHTDIDGNLAMGIRGAMTGKVLRLHEVSHAAGWGGDEESGPAGFWIPNPKQWIRRNHVCDSEGAGLWIAPSIFGATPGSIASTLGIVVTPNNEELLAFHDNTGHSCFGANLLFRGDEIDADGTVDIQYRYDPRLAGNQVLAEIHRNHSWKGLNAAYRNAIEHPHYLNWTIGDSYSVTHNGQISGHEPLRDSIDGNLIYGFSLNNENPNRTVLPWHGDVSNIKTGPVSYSMTVDFVRNWFVNFPEEIRTVVGGPFDGDIVASGPISSNDLYHWAVDKGHRTSVGNKFSNTFRGFMFPGPNILHPGVTGARAHAGAFWDPYKWQGDFGFPEDGEGRVNAYRVLNLPFLTHGGDGTSGTGTGDGVPVPCATPGYDNGVLITDEFYGCGGDTYGFVVNGAANMAAFHVDRYDDNDWGTIVGTWDCAADSGFGHFPARKGSRVRMRFTEVTPVTSFVLGLANMYREDDWFIFGLEFDTSGSVQAGYAAWPNVDLSLTTDSTRRICASVADMATLEASDGTKYFKDTGTGTVWIKVMGGLINSADPTPDPLSLEAAYRYHTLRILKV